MIKIEILSEDEVSTEAAFYYQVPPGQYIPGSADQNREPAGTALLPDEVQALKDGKLYEVGWVSDTTGLSVAARRSKLTNEWAQEIQPSIVEYKARYAAVGDWYDDEWHEV